MEFEDALEKVLGDSRSMMIPAMYIIEVLLICDDLGILKDV